MDLFTQWRAEIEAELQASREELDVNLAARDAATLAVRADRADKDLVATAFKQLLPGPISNALLIRRSGWEQGQGESAGTLLRINNAIAALRLKITDRELGLAQLDHLISPQTDDDTSEAAD
jgi:hypothetical protein